MLRSISVIQQVRRTIQSNRHLSISSIKLNGEKSNLDKSSYKLADRSSDYFTDKSTKSIQDHFHEDVKNCENIKSLFKLIGPKLSSLDTNQLKFTYIKINHLITRSTFDPDKSLFELNELIQNSKIFSCLIDRSNDSLKDLDSCCLVEMFKTLQSIGYDLRDQIVKNCIKELNSKSKKLDLNEITTCLKTISFYLAKSSTTELLKLNSQLIESARTKILTNQFDPTNINSIKKCVLLFLNPENDLNQITIDYLIQFLLSPEIKLNFKQSTDLLKKIKQGHSSFKRRKDRNLINEFFELRYKRREFYPKSIAKLVDKCNSIIYDSFSLESTESNELKLSAYLSKIHENMDSLNNELVNFYDERFLYFLTPFLLNKFKNSNLKAKTKEFVYNLNENYRRFGVYDEQLLKMVYELICRDEKLRMHNGFHFYLTYSKLRLPFIDHRFLVSKLLFNTPKKFNKASDEMKTYLLLQIRLILNDVNDERILNYLNELTNHLTEKDYELINRNEFPEIRLANVYLSKFSEMENNLKFRIAQKLTKIIDQLKKMKKSYLIGQDYFNLNNKLQRNGYLSNGLFVNAFVIYDKSIRNLASLNRFVDYFDRIDQICEQLNQNEELITFVHCPRLKGTIANYEETYNYQIKKVLNHYNIKTVEVFTDELINLDPKDQVKFLIKRIKRHSKF